VTRQAERLVEASSAIPPRAPGAPPRSPGSSTFQPRLRRSAAIGRIRALRYDALQPHAADMPEHGRAVIRRMLIETDDLPLDPAEQSGEPLLAFMQRQVAQVITVMLQQVEGAEHRLGAAASAEQWA